MGIALLYGAAALIGLVGFAFAALGIMILIVPDMQYEAALWYVLACGLIGAWAVPLLLRRLRSRRSGRNLHGM